jgi:hypothetical protein
MNIETYISIWDVDKHGNQKSLLHREKAHSWVRAYNQLFFRTIMPAVTTIVVDTDGVPRNSSGLGRCNADEGDSTFGILVGVGDGAGSATPVTINDYKLQSTIVQGTGSGQLLYGSHAYVLPLVIGNYCSWKWSRLITNSSGSAIVLTEMALVENSAGYFYTLDRTIMSPYEIADGVTRSIQYEYKTTV